MRRTLLLLAAVVQCTYVLGQLNGWPDQNVCRPGPNTTMPLPTIPKDFETRIEITIEAVDGQPKKTIEMWEFFDSTNNRGLIGIMAGGNYGYQIYNYRTNEIYDIQGVVCVQQQTVNGQTVTMPGPCMNTLCVTESMSDGNTFLVGHKLENGTLHMFSTAQALWFDASRLPITYIGEDTVRGIPVQHWRQCNYIDKWSSTFTVDYYWSKPVAWVSASGPAAPSVPVRVVVQGQGCSPTASTCSMRRAFRRQYEFTFFRPALTVDGKIFQPPENVLCLNEKLSLSLPPLPDRYAVRTEYLTNIPSAGGYETIIAYYDTWYDYGYKLSRMDFLVDFVIPVQTIQDFNTGIEYQILPTTGNCSVTPISNQTWDTVFTDPYHVRMRNPFEWFMTDKYPPFYQGKQMTRGMRTDVWLAARADWPPTNPMQSEFTYYYSSAEYQHYMGSLEQRRVPVKLQIRVNAHWAASFHLGLTATAYSASSQPINSASADKANVFTWNYFKFVEEHPYIWVFDTTQCFPESNKMNIMFKVPAEYKAAFQLSETLARDVFLYELARVMTVSPLRIQNIGFSYTSTSDVTVRFTLLGNPPVTGNVAVIKPQTSLDVARTLLKNAIDTNSFRVTIQLQNVLTVVVPASPGTIVENAIFDSQSDNLIGFSGGAMAGLAIGLLIVTIAMGLGLMFLLNRGFDGAPKAPAVSRSGGGNSAPTEEKVAGGLPTQMETIEVPTGDTSA
ncbi:hypothetical protein Bbelb_286000 [Branchiostoma belcheri]|nr:hypothetical protein Bbelb_286000 [Branchiostoma belcheri]